VSSEARHLVDDDERWIRGDRRLSVVGAASERRLPAAASAQARPRSPSGDGMPRSANQPGGSGRAPAVRSTQRRPPLQPEAERALVLAAKDRRGTAREQLIDTFAPLVGSYARLYRKSPRIDHSELMQQGAVGLLRALERFDTERQTPFWAYAAWWVREAMQELFSELARPVVLSDRAERQLTRINGARHAHLLDRGRDASLAEIAASTGLGLPQVTSLVAAGRPSRSLDEPMRTRGFDTRLGEQIADPSAEEAFDTAPWPIDVSMLRPLLQVLSPRERRVVTARFGVDCTQRALRELGVELGISAERVRQIEERALNRLHHEVSRGTWRRPARGLDAPRGGPTSGSARTSKRRPRGVEDRRSPHDEHDGAVSPVAARRESAFRR
jgi:RNA polymerase sigma factor (sigma-70 family)